MLPKGNRLHWLLRKAHERGEMGITAIDRGLLSEYQGHCGNECSRRLLSNDLSCLWSKCLLRRDVQKIKGGSGDPRWTYRYLIKQKGIF